MDTLKIRIVNKGSKLRKSGPVCPWMVDYPETPAN
jgi:hypothetical protein